MVVGVSDFAMRASPVQTWDREPDGVAAGQCATHPQQTKHFQRGSATVLCTTVNLRAVFIAQHFCGAAAQRPAKYRGLLPAGAIPGARWGDHRIGESGAQRAIAPE